MDGGIQTKEGGTPDHRQARDVQTAVDHAYKWVGKTAANFTTLRMFARVKAKPKGFRPPKPSRRRRNTMNLNESSDEEEYNIVRIYVHKPRHSEAKHLVFNVKIN